MQEVGNMILGAQMTLFEATPRVPEKLLAVSLAPAQLQRHICIVSLSSMILCHVESVCFRLMAKAGSVRQELEAA